MLGLVRASGLLEAYEETEVGTKGKDDWGYKIDVKRRGMAAASDTFTIGMAKTAGLAGKQGPWTQYPQRMLKFRCRGFLLRDQFGDVLKGLISREEAMDMPREINLTPDGPEDPEDLEAELASKPGAQKPASATTDPKNGESEPEPPDDHADILTAVGCPEDVLCEYLSTQGMRCKVLSDLTKAQLAHVRLNADVIKSNVAAWVDASN